MRENVVQYREADIISVNETHLTDNKEIKLSGYHWFGHNRSVQHTRAKKGYGGVGFFIKQNVCRDYDIVEEFNSFDDMYGLLFKNKATGYSFMVYSIYLPPESSTFYCDAPDFFNKLLVEIYKNISFDALYFVGDINARVGSLKDTTGLDNLTHRKSLDDSQNNHGKAFIEFLHDANCCIANGRINPENDNFTSISTKGRSVVDYLFFPHDDIQTVTEFYVDTCVDIVSHLGIESLVSENCKIPDHSLLSFKIRTSPYVVNLCKNLGSKNYYRQTSNERYNLRTIPNDFMKSDRFNLVINELIDRILVTRDNQNDIDAMYDSLVKTVLAEMKENLTPLSKSGRRKNTPFRPYWCAELSQLWKRAHDMHNMYVRYKGHRSIKEQHRQNFTSARNAFDKALRTRQRSYRRGLLIDIEECDTSNPRKFWNHIHKLGPRKDNNIPWEVYDSDGDVCYDKGKILKKWEDDYCDLFNANTGKYDNVFLSNVLSQKSNIERNMLDPLYAQNAAINKQIEISEVRKVVNKAKLGKAYGTDCIPNDVLKNDNMIKAMHSLFQTCFDYGMIPSVWTEAIICPIPKSRTNDPRIPLNYRGLSILSCVYKLYSSLLNNRVLSYLEENNLLHDEQNGFRKNRSCADHIFTISSIVKNKLNDNASVYAAYVDFRKAFDMVNRDMLLYRLLENGVDGKMYFAIKNIYNRASCAIRINDEMTGWFETTQGVKQGDNLSPTCFLSYVNPLIGVLKSTQVGVKFGPHVISVLAYADDLVLLAENEHDLQLLLDTLYDWCYKWRLAINIDKTKVMHFRNKDRTRTQFNFNVNGQKLEIVNSYKYLGILLEEFLDFSKTAELLAGAAGRALGAVINKVKSNKDLGYRTYTTLIDMCVMPILAYSSGVWGLKHYKCCEDVLLRASRYYMGVHRFAPIPGIQGDMGWLDCKSRWAIEAVRLYNRFVNMDPNRLNKLVFEQDKTATGHNWHKQIKLLLDDCNVANFLQTGQQIPLELFKNRINERFAADWEHHCATKPKLRTYVTFKDDPVTASHIRCNMPKYERSLISQLRLGILPLRIETGRYSKLEAKDRLCLVCNSNVVEDEYHFLFKCNFYSTIRSRLETDIGCNFTNMTKERSFKIIFQHPFKLATYVKAAFDKRKSEIYK